MNQIRLAKISDISEIMKFIEDNWKSNHILARDKSFFKYEHQNDAGINFAISIENNKINGVLGFIKYSNIASDIATVIWKALKSKSNPMLGIELLQFLRDQNDHNILFSLGVNKKTMGIYNYLDIHTGYLDHYIIINSKIHNFNILKIESNNHIKKMQFIEDSQYQFIQLDKNSFNPDSDSCFDFDFKNNKFIPRKDRDYFVKRFLNHPLYKYKVYGIYKASLPSSLVVTRKVTIGDSSILRIVDYTGNDHDIVYFSKFLYQIMIDRDYEYIDFACFGFDSVALKKAGFEKINLESEEVVAPSYFNPLLKENIKINFMIDTKRTSKIRFCIADGDQDRPV